VYTSFVSSLNSDNATFQIFFGVIQRVGVHASEGRKSLAMPLSTWYQGAAVLAQVTELHEVVMVYSNISRLLRPRELCRLEAVGLQPNRDPDKRCVHYHILDPILWIRCIEQCSCFRSRFYSKDAASRLHRHSILVHAWTFSNIGIDIIMTLAFPISISLSVKGSQHIFFHIYRNYGKTNSTIFASVVRRLGKKVVLM
jgi:hypothetical protein